MVKNKLILVSPGGLKGFYTFGVLTYLKNNYNMNKYNYSGASAGAWNSLLMCCKKDPYDINQFIESLFEPLEKAKSIMEIQILFKNKLLTNFSDNDFDFTRLYIGVTNINNGLIETNIHTNFTDLNDAINCCSASSHIPLLTGNIVNKYRDKISFDGGFSSYPFLKIPNKKPLLHIKPEMFDKTTSPTLLEIINYFSIEKNNMEKLYRKGIDDAQKNKHMFKHLKKNI